MTEGIWAVDHLLTPKDDFVSRLREFESRLQANLSEIFCPVHLCLGQEGVPAALHEVIRPEDWLFSSHRAHGHYMAKGGDMDSLWDEIMGLETGINGGFSGSQEFSDVNRRFHCSAIVGGLIGVATGAAMAMKQDGSDAIVVCVFGDAAVEQGVAWESFNYAALHQLPISYICENNGLSIQVPIWERQARSIQDRMAAFGINGCVSVQDAVAMARQGKPAFCVVDVNRDCDHLNMATCPLGYKEGI